MKISENIKNKIDRHWELRREILNTPPIYFWKINKLTKEYNTNKKEILKYI